MIKKILLIVSIVVLFVSCNQEPEVIPPVQPEVKTLKVVSNVTGIQETRAIGDSVEGVLLTYHNGSGKTITGSFEITDDETVYLEALGRTLYTEDDRVYNYVLYMPELIRTLYKDYCQVSDDHGSSVWWYFSQYYGIERGDWESALKTILDNQEGLTFPEKEEIGKDWVPQNTSDIKHINIIGRIYTYNPETGSSNGKEGLYNKTFKYYYVERNTSHLICYPIQIYTAYQLGGGTTTTSPDDMHDAAMYWYLETYFNISPSDLENIILEGKIEEFLTEVNTKNIVAKPEDVTSGYRTMVSSVIPSSIKADEFEIRYAYAYLPETLVFEDGTFVADNERLYINVEEWSNNRTVYWIYLPSSMISAYEEYVEKEWNGESELFAYHLYKSGFTETFEEASSYLHGKCLIPRELLEKALSNGKDE